MNGDREVLVVLTVPQALVEVVVDWLLTRIDGTGFSSYAVAGHSAHFDALSLSEQVTGRQRRHQFQIELPEAQLEEFIAAARDEFGAAGVHYWVVPIIAGGHLGD